MRPIVGIAAFIFSFCNFVNAQDNELLIRRSKDQNIIEFSLNNTDYKWEVKLDGISTRGDFGPGRQGSGTDGRGQGSGGQGFNPGRKVVARQPVLAKPILIDGRKPINPVDGGRPPIGRDSDSFQDKDLIFSVNDVNGRIRITLDDKNAWEIDDEILLQIFPEIKDSIEVPENEKPTTTEKGSNEEGNNVEETAGIENTTEKGTGDDDASNKDEEKDDDDDDYKVAYPVIDSNGNHGNSLATNLNNLVLLILLFISLILFT